RIRGHRQQVDVTPDRAGAFGDELAADVPVDLLVVVVGLEGAEAELAHVEGADVVETSALPALQVLDVCQLTLPTKNAPVPCDGGAEEALPPVHRPHRTGRR